MRFDARFGDAIPRVDVSRVAARDPLAHSRFRPTGDVPFGLFGDDDANDDVESFFTKVFGRVEVSLDDLRDDLKDFFDFF